MAISTRSLVISLSDEQRDILQTFADEQGIEDISDAVGTLLEEYVRVVDALWDEKLAHSGDLLDKLAAEAQAEADAGLTIDLDPDSMDNEI